MALLIPTYLKMQRDRDAGVALPTEGQTEAGKILTRLGSIPSFDRLIFGNRVLVAKYMPERAHGTSLHLTEEGQKENEYQNKIGLVIKTGHLAFKSDHANDFGPDKVEAGDWIFYDFAAGWNMNFIEIGKVGASAHIQCKVLRDTDILGVLPGPEYLY